MNGTPVHNPSGKPVAVLIGATSKWQASGANTLLAHGGRIGGDELPRGSRWGLGGALAQKFAAEGHVVVLTTRRRENAAELVEALSEDGAETVVIEMELGSEASVKAAFDAIRDDVGAPDVVVFNAGYMAGRELSPAQELLEHFPSELFDQAIQAAAHGPFYVAKSALPGMRERGRGTLLFTNNQYSLRGRKRNTGESLYYPRTLMRALAQALTEEYSEFGVHVANIIVDGFIDSPGTRNLEQFRNDRSALINPWSIAEAYYYLYQQDPSCWTHELQLTPAATKPSY